MNGAMLLVMVGFTFSTNTDPFTDQVTYIAQSGDDSGPFVSIQCSAATQRKFVVMLSAGHRAYQPDYAMVARYEENIRFDGGRAFKIGVRYDGEFAYLTGKDAELFVAAAKQANSFVMELSDYDGDRSMLQVPLAGAREAISEVERFCFIRKK